MLSAHLIEREIRFSGQATTRALLIFDICWVFDYADKDKRLTEEGHCVIGFVNDYTPASLLSMDERGDVPIAF